MVLSNLACKLRHLVEHVWAWLLSKSCGHVMAWCDVVLLCRPWWHYRHGGASPSVLCDVVLVVVFIIASWFPRASYRSWLLSPGHRSPCWFEELRTMILILRITAPSGLDGP
jgi:hypothetical protein